MVLRRPLLVVESGVGRFPMPNMFVRRTGSRTASRKKARSARAKPSRHHDGQASRARILALVERDPGIHVSEIAERTGMAWHTTSYHLAVLAKTRQLVVHKSARDRHVFLRTVPARHRPWLAAMRAEPAPELVRTLLDRPGQDIPTLSARVGQSGKVVRRRIASLAKAGVVERIGTWRPVFKVRAAAAPHVAPPPARDRHHLAGLVGSWHWDPRGNRPDLSPESFLILGLPQRRGPTCESLIDFVHAQDRRALSAAIRLTVLGGEPYDKTVRMRTPHGERHIRQRGWVSVRGRNGKASQLSGTLEDVTGHAAPHHPRPEPAPRQASKPAPVRQRSGRIRRFVAGLWEHANGGPAGARGHAG